MARLASQYELSILLLTEDSGKHAHRVLEAVSKKLVRLVDDQCQTHKVDFAPANDQARASMHANAWKSRNRRKLIALARVIAERVAMNRGYVFFHADGDVPWSQRHNSENRQKFEREVIAAVRKQLRAGGSRAQPRTEAQVDELLKRLILLMPFYSMEAWLYQNIDVALKLCREHHGGQGADRFMHWRDHRHELDEVTKPKECVCLADGHNLELAIRAYPAQAAYAAGASLASVVERMRACTDLAEALAATTAAP